MEDVSFNEEPQALQRPMASHATGLSGLLIKWGVAKNESETTPILIGVLVIMFIAIIGIWFLNSDSSEPPPPLVVPGEMR